MRTVTWIRGLTCQNIAYDTKTREWVFGFGPGVSLRVAAPWRIIANGRIELGHEDHGQQFGLPKPVDGVAAAMELLRGHPVDTFTVAATSADAAIDFGNGRLLQIFNSSSGYEGWEMSDGKGRQMIAQGGGRLVEFPPATT